MKPSALVHPITFRQSPQAFKSGMFPPFSSGYPKWDPRHPTLLNKMPALIPPTADIAPEPINLR